MVITWRTLAPLGSGAPPASSDDAPAAAGSWRWLGRPALVVFFASGLGLGMVQAAVLSYLPLYAVQDHWLPERRSLWLALTGAIGAVIFAAYAAWFVILAFASGVGVYGWVGISFIVSAQRWVAAGQRGS